MVIKNTFSCFKIIIEFKIEAKIPRDNDMVNHKLKIKGYFEYYKNENLLPNEQGIMHYTAYPLN